MMTAYWSIGVAADSTLVDASIRIESSLRVARYAFTSDQSDSTMPSRLVHAWRADSIWPRCASTSGVGEQAAATKVLSTSRTSVDDSFARSGVSACAPLHHAGGAARAVPSAINDDTPHTVAMASILMGLSSMSISYWP